MSTHYGFECGRVLRWHEPTVALDDGPPYGLQIFDSELGIWLTLVQANLEEDAMAQGIPVLRGPYVVDFSDIPHDGDTKVLWTPQVGDVLLRLFPDWRTVTQWDTGALYMGQSLTTDSLDNAITIGNVGAIGRGSPGGLDNVTDAVGANAYDASGAFYCATAQVFTTADPMQIMLFNPGGGPDPSHGHVEVYALVARAVAP